VTIEAGTVRPARLELRCVTHPPDSEHCGVADGSTIRYVVTGSRLTGVPPEFVIMVTGDNARVPQPTIDRS
ncbi:MAG TPA: hypothetical protein VNT24_12710, partial [Propionibacteriaceae bacterium]|nr:hypothetical protein [Propionibacteriaceae bacterium]